jgi:hypothetical protein
VATVKTTQEGNYFFPSVQPVSYDITFDAAGFRKSVLRGVKVDTGMEASLKAMQMEVSTQTEVVEVAADVTSVQTSNAEVASVITNEQVRRLPTLNRSPLALIATQAGVSANGRTNTTINGLRPSYANVTIDGINMQDNFIRTNGLDFQPNMLQLDQVGEFTLATSNTNASAGSGAAQLTFVTPSGTNDWHGSLYWFNRNNVTSANDWFNNRNGVSRPFLNQNQAGGSASGPIIKNKLFFYANYEATRQRQQSPATRTILREDARQGIFTYLDSASGARRTANIFTASGLRPDTAMASLLGAMPAASAINRNDIGDNLNTGGYGFNIRNNRTRDNVTGKADYIHSPKNVFTGSYLWNRDIVDRPAQSNDYSTDPKVKNDNSVNLLSGTWRWSPVGSFTNELRGGYNMAPALFLTSEDFGSRIIGTPLISNPVNTFRAQGRYTDTYNLSNNSTWFKGKHTLAFGFQYQNVHADPYNDDGNLPTYTLAVNGVNFPGFSATQLPGVRSQDIGIANNLLALLGGLSGNAAQTFNVTDRTSGYVAGATNLRRMRQQNLGLYLNDTWKVSRKLTLTLGTRWEYYTPVDEVDALFLLPTDPNPIVGLMSNSTLDFAGSAVGRPWYKKDFNNFSPNIGIAYQPFGDGKTVIRAGYSINYPNDEFIVSLRNSVNTNAGLAQNNTLINMTSTVGGGLPNIPTPAFRVPRTVGDNYALDPAQAIATVDPSLVTPYVQQWNFGIQREVAKGILEVRYVGNRSTKQFRAFDVNQVNIQTTAGGTTFLDDFKRAQQNGLLAQGSGLGFNPVYNPNLPGSQPLNFFNALPGGGRLATDATVRNNIQQSNVGELANYYQTRRFNGNVNFYGNPFTTGANLMTNYSNANYNGLQIDYRRTIRGSLQMQANYTYSKVMSDTAGDGQTRFEPFLDNASPSIERARTPFDLTHAFKFNAVWDTPIGKGKALDFQNGILNNTLGGWTLSGIMTWTSGAPVSILSSRSTVNRAGRSANNTAIALDTKDKLEEVVKFTMTGNGPYFIDLAAIGPDGRGTSPDLTAPFAGQRFFNPGVGQLGTLQRRSFSGPMFWNTNIAILKTVNISERHRIEIRGEAFNFTNSPSFFIGDMTINSNTFGRITSTLTDRRIMQFGLYYKF